MKPSRLLGFLAHVNRLQHLLTYFLVNTYFVYQTNFVYLPYFYVISYNFIWQNYLKRAISKYLGKK